MIPKTFMITELAHHYSKGNSTKIYDITNSGNKKDIVDIRLTKDFIIIGCAKVDIDVIEYILQKYKEHFKPPAQEVVI